MIPPGLIRVPPEYGNSEVQHFYQDAVIFITGATGFLGKVLVEKLLRSCQGIKKIYLLIRRKKESNSAERLALLLKSECFERLHQECPASLNKLAVVDGDLAEENLGLNFANYHRLASEVSVVFHCAATTRFNNTLRNAVKINVEGTRSVLELCHIMKGIKAIVHVSTVFVNCEEYTLEEKIYLSTVKADDIISLAKTMNEDALQERTPGLLGAKPNTYVFSKSLAESVVAEYSRGLPAVIVRPSIVSASWKEPFSGWVDGLLGGVFLVIASVSGLMTTIMADKTQVMDIIPVDVVANALIVAAQASQEERNMRSTLQAGLVSAQLVPDWLYREFLSSYNKCLELVLERSLHQQQLGRHPVVYNCASGTINKLSYDQVESLTNKMLRKHPAKAHFGRPGLKLTRSRFYYAVNVFLFNYLPAVFFDLVLKITGRKAKVVELLKKSKRAMESVLFVTTHTWNVSSNNFIELHERSSPMDRETFPIELRCINWEDYWEDFVIGIRRYALKQDPPIATHSPKKIKRLKFLQMILVALLLLGFITVATRFCRL